MSKGRVCIVEPGYTQEDPYSDPGVRTAREQRCRCCGRPFIRYSPFCCNPCAVRYTMRKRMDNKVDTKTCVVCGNLFATHDHRRVTCSPRCQDEEITGARHRRYRRRTGRIRLHLDAGKNRHRPACNTPGDVMFASTLDDVDCPNCKHSKAYRRLKDGEDKARRA